MVRQPLPPAVLFLIAPNQSDDGHALQDDEELFPADSLPEGERLGPWPARDAASWLWRDGKIPEWIDVRVVDADENASYVLLECCGRFTALRERLYHREEGDPPFHVTSPALPPRWESVEKHGRFDLEAVAPGRDGSMRS